MNRNCVKESNISLNDCHKTETNSGSSQMFLTYLFFLTDTRQAQLGAVQRFTKEVARRVQQTTQWKEATG